MENAANSELGVPLRSLPVTTAEQLVRKWVRRFQMNKPTWCATRQLSLAVSSRISAVSTHYTVGGTKAQHLHQQYTGVVCGTGHRSGDQCHLSGRIGLTFYVYHIQQFEIIMFHMSLYFVSVLQQKLHCDSCFRSLD